MLQKKLLYGHDVAIASFADAIETGRTDSRICGERGKDVVRAMDEVIAMIKNGQ